MKKILIVSPVFNEEVILPKFLEAFLAFRAQLLALHFDISLLLVDDGSTDRTFPILAQWTPEHSPYASFLSLAGNFGHQAALVAGMLAATDHYDAVVTMDSDLEHPFSAVRDMLSLWASTSCQIINSERKSHQKLPLSKRVVSKLYYAVVRTITGVSIKDGSADFRLWDGYLLQQIQPYLPNILSLRVFAAWLPVPKLGIRYEQDIATGKVSRFRLNQSLRLAIDSLIQFSEAPFLLYLGVSVAVLSACLLYLVYIVWMWLQGLVIPGWTSLAILTITLNAVSLSGFAVIGTYLRRLQFKNQLPRYLLKKPPTSSKR